MNTSGRQMLALLALLSVFLVNSGAILADEIGIKEKESLPPLIVEDAPSVTEKPALKENEQSLVKKEQKEESPPRVEPMIPSASEKEEEKITNESPKSNIGSSSKESEPKAAAATTTITSQTTLQVSNSAEQPSNKDISVLLANKDDTENDLASPQSPTSQLEPAKTPSSSDSGDDLNEKRTQIDLDSPVDTTIVKADENTDRFHYNVVVTTSSEKTTESTTTTTQKPVESTTLALETTPQPEDSSSKKDTSKIEQDSNLDSRKQEQAPPKEEEKIKTVVIEDNSFDIKPKADQPTATAATTTTEKIEPSATTAPSAASTTNSEPIVSSSTSPPEVKEENKTTVASPKQNETEKAASVPSILAVALGTALGAAVNGKSLPSTTTIKPPVSTSTAASKKSATDRWDNGPRWSPSSTSTSTSAPPTRRRPILPSIRRRFRPYNRFSPFPWGGADSYIPLGSSEADLRPQQEAGSSRPNKSAGRRRNSTDSTKTTTSWPPTTSASMDEDDEELQTTTRQPTKRRGVGQPGHKRRHHQHHEDENPPDSERNRRKHRRPSISGSGSGTRHHGSGPSIEHSADELPRPFEGGSLDPFESSFGSGLRPLSSGFGLFNTGTGSGFDLLNPISSWLDEFSGNSNNKPTFGSHRPPHRGQSGQEQPHMIGSPSRLPGHKPVPVEGEFNGPAHERDIHIHQGHGHGGHGHGRDEYDHDHHHDHHHDCHDHEYDHDHHDHHRDPYRPQRPNREPIRPPVGGDYDTYPPSRPSRPSRPYNRRDQTTPESSSNTENRNKETESSPEPSLYNPKRVADSSPFSSQSSPVAPPRRSSLFSPFDTLFGNIDDGLFSLRASVIDGSPAKPDWLSVPTRSFDSIVSSPKISNVPKKNDKETAEEQ